MQAEWNVVYEIFTFSARRGRTLLTPFDPSKYSRNLDFTKKNNLHFPISVPGYYVYENTMCYGDVRNFRGSIGACKANCNADPNCKGFEFQVSGMSTICWIKEQSQMCTDARPAIASTGNFYYIKIAWISVEYAYILVNSQCLFWFFWSYFSNFVENQSENKDPMEIHKKINFNEQIGGRHIFGHIAPKSTLALCP